MTLDVALTPAGVDGDDLAGRAVVVIDVLRASTSIVTALANGARAVIPVASQGEAGRLAATLDPDVTLLAGERDGRTLPGFAAGNSPAEFSEAAVRSKTVVLTTTNGTGALVAARGAARVAVGAFVNAGAAADFLRQALADGLDATVVCAGHRRRVSVEDTLCAGLLVDRVVGSAAGLSDGARIAWGLFQGARGSLARTILDADHTRRLLALGAAADVAACVRLDTTRVLPVLRDTQLVRG